MRGFSKYLKDCGYSRQNPFSAKTEYTGERSFDSFFANPRVTKSRARTETIQNHQADEGGQEREREREIFTELEMSHASIRHRGRSTRMDSDESSADSGTESSVVESETYEGEISLIGGIGIGREMDSLMENRGGARVMEENFKSGEDEGGRKGKGKGVKLSRFANRASTPTHRRVKESPLSSDSIFNQSHAGLFNLCIVVLVAVNSRLIIENLMKYGLLIRTGFWFSSKSLRDWPLLMCCLTLPLFPVCSFTVEKLARCKFFSESFAIVLQIIICMGVILYPILVILRFNDSAVLSGITLMLLACIVWLKLVSYAHTNYDMRNLSNLIDKEDTSCNYPNIDGLSPLDFKSLVYFMVAPTLCYQATYPRTACIRKSWVIRQSIKLVIFTGVMGFIVEQYINPIVKNSQHPLNGNLLNAIERVLKLSVPTLYVWLCMFYCFFHLWLNILAELLRFGDREFYKDWWNAKTIEEYWKMWNMPVHKWMVRHIYFPCLRKGASKGFAVLIAFLMSAIFHEWQLRECGWVPWLGLGTDELCVAVPCHIFKFWAFIGILFQVPLVILTNYLQQKFRNDMVGNMIFWSFFCILGQPMCVLLYYHDVMNRRIKS